jgi:glycine/D-amino acid oxidase-like deaminating enzyme
MTLNALSPCLYADTARPAPVTPGIDGSRRVSVAVVGGGFTGLSAALHLAERGVDVAVLEAHEPGWGASGRNGGQVNPGLKPDPDEVERDFGPDLGARMVAFGWNAPNVVFDLIARHRIACDAAQNGTLRVAYNTRNAAGIRASHAQGARRGMPVDLLEAPALQQGTGARRYVAGMLDRRGGHVNPLGYARGLAQAAMQAGARVHGDTSVTRLTRADGAWQVETPTGTLTAETVILATNGYTDELWPGLARSVVPVYSGIVATAPLPERVAREILPLRSAVYELGHITTYYRLDAQNRLLMGGRSRQTDLAGPGSMAWMARYAERLWPVLKGVAWTHGWNGQLAITVDHYPHLHTPAPGLVACLGYNGRGVAMATAMGAQLTRLLLQPEVPLDMPVSAVTPIWFHAFWKQGVAIRVATGRLRDALGL